MNILRLIIGLVDKLGFSIKRNLFSLQLKSCGNDTKFWKGVVIHAPNMVSIGSNTGVGDYVVIWGGGGVDIGDDVLIAAHSVLTSQGHDPNGGLYRKTSIKKPIVIDNNVWIGAGCVILPGVKIGNNTIIGAGSIVTKDIPKNSIAYGCPAQVKATRL